jgi:hypothetical protein
MISRPALGFIQAVLTCLMTLSSTSRQLVVWIVIHLKETPSAPGVNIISRKALSKTLQKIIQYFFL